MNKNITLLCFFIFLVFNSCSSSQILEMNNDQLNELQFEYKCGSHDIEDSFSKNALILGELPLYLDFISVKIDPSTNKITLKGYARDYQSGEGMMASIIFAGIIYEDDEQIVYNTRIKYRPDVKGYFEITTEFDPDEIIVVRFMGYLVTYYDLSKLPVL